MGYNPQESLENTINTMGYTVRGTPNCPLINCNLVKYLYDFIDLETFKKSPFHYTDWFIGILVLAYCSPHKKEQYNPLYKTTKQGEKNHIVINTIKWNRNNFKFNSFICVASSKLGFSMGWGCPQNVNPWFIVNATRLATELGRNFLHKTIPSSKHFR